MSRKKREAFGVPPEFGLNLQSAYDLARFDRSDRLRDCVKWNEVDKETYR